MPLPPSTEPRLIFKGDRHVSLIIRTQIRLRTIDMFCGGYFSVEAASGGEERWDSGLSLTVTLRVTQQVRCDDSNDAKGNPTKVLRRGGDVRRNRSDRKILGAQRGLCSASLGEDNTKVVELSRTKGAEFGLVLCSPMTCPERWSVDPSISYSVALFTSVYTK
ncbi:hypothetical protein AMATHDRAFT_50083 [Amanita thiersii Skay4041]|uniref:Uncharacterized protein n=1 Tax=Amanita thiersii Skay4041 TaxID=703135 RepID=A0A2A9NJ41_9AGAR|nr:hypothetical protein AMATHDRAFT_50083 [Amanita thiersii Skay4041]